MSTIWREDPEKHCPAASLNKGTKRYKVGPYWVDWNDKGEPTLEKVEAILAPPSDSAAA